MLRKVSDLPGHMYCHNPEHNPLSMIVLRDLTGIGIVAMYHAVVLRGEDLESYLSRKGASVAATT